MLSGKQFIIATPTVAIDTDEGKRVAVTVPADAIIEVVSDLTPDDKMVDVLWDGRVVAMFAIDIRERGTAVTNP